MKGLYVYESMEQITFLREDDFAKLFTSIYSKLSKIPGILGIGFRYKSPNEIINSLARRKSRPTLPVVNKYKYFNYSVIIFTNESFSPSLGTTICTSQYHCPGSSLVKKKSIVNLFSKVPQSEFYQRLHKTNIKTINFLSRFQNTFIDKYWCKDHEKFVGIIKYTSLDRKEKFECSDGDDSRSDSYVYASLAFKDIKIDFYSRPGKMSVSSISLLSYSTSPKEYNF